MPVTQIVPSGEVFAPRFLYLPLLFGAPLIGSAIGRGVPERFHGVVAPVLACLLAWLSFERAAVYADRAAWRAEVLHHMPNDVASWNDLGLIREEAGDAQGAHAAWRHAIALDPNYSRSWSNLGRVQLMSGDLDAAESSLRAALRVGPRNAVVRVNLASLLAKLDRHLEAVDSYEQATRIAPGLAPAWRGLGQSLLALGRAAEARFAVQHSLDLDLGERSAQTLLRRIDAFESNSPTH